MIPPVYHHDTPPVCGRKRPPAMWSEIAKPHPPVREGERICPAIAGGIS